jgi:ADP-ribose pyrophosphatase
MIKRILMATDGSKTSVRALKVAIEMAKKMGAKLSLVGVIDNRLYVGRTMPASASPTRISESVEDYLMQVAGAYLADASRQCEQSGIEPDIVIRTGHPAEEILKLVYKGPVFNLFEDDVELPNGRVVRRSRVEHRPTIGVVPYIGDGQIVLIRQHRHAVGTSLIEIPAGTMDKGDESPEECVQRELAEEAGFRAGRLVKLFGGYLVPGYADEFMHFYLAFELIRAPLPPDEDEFIETMTCQLRDALRMIRDGRIVDSKTALALLLAADYLRENKMTP